MFVLNPWIVYIGKKKQITWIHEIDDQCIECFVNKNIYIENKNYITVLYQQKKVDILESHFDENFNNLQLIVDKNKKIKNLSLLNNNAMEKFYFVQIGNPMEKNTIYVHQKNNNTFENNCVEFYLNNKNDIEKCKNDIFLYINDIPYKIKKVIIQSFTGKCNVYFDEINKENYLDNNPFFSKDLIHKWYEYEKKKKIKKKK